jgi:hypothetical protein
MAFETIVAAESPSVSRVVPKAGGDCGGKVQACTVHPGIPFPADNGAERILA